jgi:hypothetical protein
MTTFNDPGARPSPPPTVLRGPAHADNYRIQVGRYGDRWYRDPLPYDGLAPEALSDEAYPSVSGVKKASGNDWSYVTMKRIANSDDLDEIAKRPPAERYERFKTINKLDLNAAMQRGTNVHTWAECLAYGAPQHLTDSDVGGEFFPIVDRLFADLNPTLVAAEFVCISRTLNGVGYGGTADGIFEIDGKRWIVDWKSRGADSAHAAYPEEAGQVAAYARCQYIIVEDDDPRNPYGAKRMLPPVLDGGLIVSIKPDSYEVFPIDLDEAAEHFRAMHAWWVARQEERVAIKSKWPPRRSNIILQAQIALAPDPSEARKLALYARHDAMDGKLQAEFKERIAGIDTTDLDAIERLMDDIENPPTMLDMARERMRLDAERETARRLAAERLEAEGGEAAPADVALFQARWEFNMNAPARRWTGQIVQEAIDAGVDFRISELNSQRRADIYNVLTEWAVEYEDSEALRAAVKFAAPTIADSLFDPNDPSSPLGLIIGLLTTAEAAELRRVVAQIVEGEMAYIYASDGVPRWELSTTTTSAS